MTYDLLIRNGTIIDGTGAPRYQGEIAVRNGRITRIGKVGRGEDAIREIDADGLTVAPGFIDPHTHYDAQLCWDPRLTCSSWHGVTSVIVGNCGVGIAPCQPNAREVAMWDLVNVEGIPFDVLSAGITWDWDTFPAFMAAARARGSALNVGFFAPLTPFRHFVMGEAAMHRAATADETAQIKALLAGAINAGAMGFSTTNSPQHVGFQGRPLACRLASRNELGAYASVLREASRGVIEIALCREPSSISDEECELLKFLLDASGRRVTWLAIFVDSERPEKWREMLNKARPLIERGGVPQVSCRPFTATFGLQDPFLFARVKSWKPAFNQPVEVQKRVYADPAFRCTVRAEINEHHALIDRLFEGGETVVIHAVNNPALKHFEGATVGKIAKERGCGGLETMFDISIADSLKTRFTVAMLNVDQKNTGELVRNPEVMLGLSDGGAHLDMLCDAGYCTYLLARWVRERGLMSLEDAIRRITTEPARFFGLEDRGQLAVGAAADITIFDPEQVDCDELPRVRNDLPGSAPRLVVESRGIHYTVVNGAVVYDQGNFTKDLPGQVLRPAR
jgi:N-acyl-D-amino-acid deacylase